MGAADLERWQARWAARGDALTADLVGRPEPFLVRCGGELPPGPVLDAACGDGRNALWLAETPRDRAVTAIDVAPAAIDRLRAAASGRGLAGRIEALAADLDDGGEGIAPGPFAALVVVRYKPSPAQWDRLLARLTPGGRLLLCSFGRAQHDRRGFPLAYCLDRAELEAALTPLGMRSLTYETFDEGGDALEGSLWERA